MWTSVIPGVVAAAVLLTIPGAAVLAALRVRVVTAVIASPPVSLAIILISAFAASAARRPWGVGWVLGTALVLAAAALALALLTPLGRRIPSASGISGAAALQYLGGQVIAGVMVTPLYLMVFISPQTIAQRFDNAFHLNAIAAIVRTGGATPFDTGRLVRGRLYPNGWHELAALVMETSGLSLEASVHAAALVTVIGLWPMSMWLLVEVLVRPRWAGRMLTGTLALATTGFPLVLIDWGLVYPTILGFSVAPVLAALVISTARGRPILASWGGLLLGGGLIVIGSAIAHPSTTVAALILTLPILIAALLGALDHAVVQPRIPFPSVAAKHARRLPAAAAARRHDRRRTAALALASLIVLAIWATVTPSFSTAPWQAFETGPQALGEALSGAVMGRRAVPVVTGLILIGIMCCLAGWTRHRDPVLALIVPASVYIAAASATEAPLRDALSGLFYRDNFRAAAFVTLAAVPLAVAAVDLISRWTLAPLLRRIPLPSARWLRPILAGVLGLGLAWLLAWLVTSNPDLRAQYRHASEAYRTWQYSDIVSGDEFTMFEELPQYVPRNGYVVADPWEGGGLTYALGDRQVDELYMTTKRTDEERYRDANFRDIATDPKICESLPADRPLYYLDLDEHRLGADKAEDSGYLGYEGITPETEGFTVVHRVGTATLYRIDACSEHPTGRRGG